MGSFLFLKINPPSRPSIFAVTGPLPEEYSTTDPIEDLYSGNQNPHSFDHKLLVISDPSSESDAPVKEPTVTVYNF